jgi:hypothetical protein
MTTLTGYIVRETEAAVAFVAAAKTSKPLWIPRKKISSLTERDEVSVSVALAGERIKRLAIPVEVEVDAAWLERVGA